MLIGLTGAAGSGKDTVAAMMKEISPSFRNYALASPIKEALNVMFGWEMSDWDDRRWKEAVQRDVGRSPRYLAQTLGTEWGREAVHPNLWLLLGNKFIDSHSDVIITDVRFNNEAVWLHDNGGVLVEVRRPEVEPVNAHASEAGVDSNLIDYSVLNNGSLDDLRGTTRVLLDLIENS